LHLKCKTYIVEIGTVRYSPCMGKICRIEDIVNLGIHPWCGYLTTAGSLIKVDQ
jgi:hypothetical protein